ncbi:MAG: ABC transporter permease [Chloroflexi bacterium]|nr:ABC transporter permease [Chloroflexota bacterium]MBI3763553.1 ABC transporter permease [Chloroflexota bacterium]
MASSLSPSKLLAFLRHGFRHASSYRLNFVGTYLSGVLVVVFFAVLARFYGNAQPAALAPYGGDYFTFLLIGGVFARYLSLGMRHFGRELEHEFAAGTIEPVMVTATPPALALLGPSLWILLEGIALMAVQLIVGVFFFGADFSRANWPSALALAALTFLALNSWGILSAGFVLVFKRADPLSWLVDVTIFMLAGVYFPIQLIPAGLRLFAYLLPLSYALEGLRFALMRGDSLVALWRYVLILIAFNAFLLPVGLLGFRFALDYVKRRGSLGHY